MKIWTFGDSFTAPFQPHSELRNKYIEFLGREPKTFTDMLSESLNCPSENLAKCGSDNYTIFQTICENCKNFKMGDLIIVGWSHILRYRLVDKNNQWRFIIPNWSESDSQFFNSISDNTIREILVNRDHEKNSQEVNSWIEILKCCTKEMCLINWTPFPWELNGLRFNGITTVRRETKNFVDDGHYGEEGNSFLHNIFLTKYKRFSEPVSLI